MNKMTNQKLEKVAKKLGFKFQSKLNQIKLTEKNGQAEVLIHLNGLKRVCDKNIKTIEEQEMAQVAMAYVLQTR